MSDQTTEKPTIMNVSIGDDGELHTAPVLLLFGVV
jgi:hypothetical protein